SAGWSWPKVLNSPDGSCGRVRLVADRRCTPVVDEEGELGHWDDGPGVIRLPDGRTVRGTGVRRPRGDVPAPEFAVYLLGRDPGITAWPNRTPLASSSACAARTSSTANDAAGIPSVTSASLYAFAAGCWSGSSSSSVPSG